MTDSNAIYTLLIVVPVILVAITVHEMMHALVGYWLGDDTAKEDGRISLNPIRHIDPFMTVLLPAVLILLHLPPFGAAKPVMVNLHKVKYEEFGWAIIALAGPISNLLMAAFGAFILKSFDFIQTSQILTDITGFFIVINIGFFVFNMIPWPPLDGSRLLYAFAPDSFRRVMEGIEQQGLIGIFILILVISYTPAQDILIGINRALTNGLLF